MVLVLPVVVATAGAVFAVLVMVLVLPVVVATAVAMLAVPVVMVVIMLKLGYSIGKSILLFHRGKNSLTVKLIHRSRYYRCIVVMLLDKLDRFLNLRLISGVGMRKNDS